MSENPYSPPESNLDQPEKKLPESIWWKVYFGISSFLILITIAGLFLIEEFKISKFDYVDFSLSMVAMTGLFGLAFSRPIGKQVFWRYFFYIALVETLFYSIALPMAGVARFGEVTSFDTWHAFEIAYTVPLIWGLYLYSFKRDYNWRIT